MLVHNGIERLLMSVGDNSDFLENAVFWGPKSHFTGGFISFETVLDAFTFRSRPFALLYIIFLGCQFCSVGFPNMFMFVRVTLHSHPALPPLHKCYS